MENITKQSPITLIELPPTLFGEFNGKIARDVFSLFKLPGRAIHTLESILVNERYKDVLSINPLYHGDGGKLTEENKKRIFESPILGISSITRTAPQSMEFAKIYKLKNPEGIIIAGGADPTFRIKEWLDVVDIVVCGEGEITLPKLIERLGEDRKELGDIKGIAYQKNGNIEVTEPREFLTGEQLSQIHPIYDPITMAGVGNPVVETTRGCPYSCDYCSVTSFYGRKHRHKSNNFVTDEIKNIFNMGMDGLIFFIDDNFAANPQRTIDLCNAIEGSGLNTRRGSAQVTVKTAENEELLDALLRAGIKRLYVGFESINNETLTNMRKPFTAEQNTNAAQKFKKWGFWIHGMMIVGADGDTPETLRETSSWANKYLDSVQLFSQVPLPGTDYHDNMVEQKRILTNDYSLYDGNHVVVRPENFTPLELQLTINNMFKSFYSKVNCFTRWRNTEHKKTARDIMIYLHLMGGIKKTLYDPQSKQHMDFLKSVG
ncbi:MAG: B12-binding domain-containing radical SAM protein [Nanoarchaeota archaeon]|nr:B12-binding domain-containing radical SAM protein [Nanoarchaeota archaeon]